MKRIGLALLAIPALATACINDRDTLAFEVRNVDALNRIDREKDMRKRATAVQELALRAIAGRFERFPDRYYQMRIERLEQKGNLTASEYDDLAVAYDRLGKVDKAIEIVLDSRSHRTTENDQYRFHANYGTFLVHRWIANGHKDSDVATLKQSIAEIKKALKIDPDSHFGRERVQLALEESWLPGGKKFEIDPEDAMVGLAGIVMMGLAYELPDAYALMAELHVPGQPSETILSNLALLRYRELVKAGGKPIAHENSSELRLAEMEQKEYRTIRADGEKVHQARLAYMNDRFARGEHPDTHPGFWNERNEPAYPVLKRIGGHPLATASVAVPVLVGIAGLSFLTVGAIVVTRRLNARRYRPSPF